MWGAKIGTSTCLAVTTDFPLVTNGFKGRFELLSRSRFQKYNQNNFWRKISKVRPLTLFHVVPKCIEGEYK